MTRARTLADMISDGVIGTTELADDAITPVKLDETGNYQVAQLEISGSSSLHDALRLTSTSSANGAGAILSYEIDGADRASMRGYIDGSTLGGNLISFTSDSSGNLQERTRITSDGHFGVASSVNANWESVRDVIQLRHGALSTNNDTQFAMSANHYYDGSASRFARAGQATMYQQLYGRHEFYLSGSGTQDAAITYSEALRLDTAGAIFNESSLDRDFRVESDNEAFMFFVNAGSDIVGIGAAVPNQAKRLRVYSDSMNSESKFLAEFSDGSNTGNDGGVLISSYLPRLCMNDLTTSSKWFDWKMDTNKLQLGYGSNTDLYTREVGGILEVSTSDAVFNQGGQDRDFRVESGNQTHMLYVDAGSNSVGVKTNATDAALNVNSQSSSTEAIRITGSGGNPFIEMVGNQGQTAIRMWENGANDPGYTTWYNQGSEQHKIQSGANETVTFNEQGLNLDFRIESNNNTHALFVDGGNDIVGIGTSSGPYYQKGNAFNARAHIANSAIIGAGYMTIISNPNGRVFTLDTGGNGQQAFLHLQGSQYNGYRDVYFWATNFSGSWTVYSNTNATSGTTPTYTIGNNSSQNPTITLSFSTGYSGGYCKVFGSTHWSVT